MAQLDLTNMVLNDINVDTITNTGKTGVFDKLMLSVNDNINDQYINNRISGSDYATVYLGSIQAVLAQSIQFVLQEQLTEVQVASAIADNDLKIKQLEIADIDKSLKQFELDSILPEQLTKLQEEIDLLQTQDSESLLNGVKDRLLKDAEVSMKAKQEDLVDSQIVGSGFDNTLKSEQATMRTYERTSIQPKQLEKLEEEIDLLQTQDLDVIAKTAISVAESAKSVLLKQEQVDSEALNNGIDGVIANQILDIKKGVDEKERQMVEAETTGVKQRLLMDEEKETSDLQQIILATEEEVKTAQLAEISDSTLRANTQLDDVLVTSTEQRAGMYTDRVTKDKQAAKLGLDNVMKNSETARDADTAFVYTPNYTGA